MSIESIECLLNLLNLFTVLLLAPSFHQGKSTSIDKVNKKISYAGDIHYNIKKMNETKERKGCLLRDASYLICNL